jgi:tetratricopeptide (TPR) repeat protein
MRRFLIVMFVCCLAISGRVSGQTAQDYANRAKAFYEKGEYDKAIDAYTQVLAAANPTDPKDNRTICHAYLCRGSVWEAKGELDKAIADYTKALAIDPKNARAYSARGVAWYIKHEHDKAIADYTNALAIDPNDSVAYLNRGAARDDKGEYDKAIADYTKAVAIYPKEYGACNNLARIYASCSDAKYRDGKKAVEYASKADQLTGGKNGRYLETLAAAYAESGDFAKAQEIQAKVIDLAPEEEKQSLRSRLELYKQGIPYHDLPVKK